MSEVDAGAFSDWYADMGQAPGKDELWTRLLGLPPHVLSSSPLTGLRNPRPLAASTTGTDGAGVDVAHVSSVGRPDGGKDMTGTRTSTYRRHMQRLEVLLLIPGRGEVR